MTKQEWERRLGIWQGLLEHAQKMRSATTNENSRKTWGYSVHRCEQGIKECKAGLAEFIGKK